jgi:hypothetical protein
MTITSTAIKDITNITFNGDIFYSGTRQINKTANGGYWYGKNVVFKTLWFYRLSDAGANEIFRYTEDYQDVTLEWTSCIGFGAMGSPAVFNCNGKEAHIVAVRKCLFGSSSTAYTAFSNASTLVANLFEGSWLYDTGMVDSISYDASCVIEGSPTYNSPDNPVLMDKASGMENDSTVSGTTVKDALENLNSGDITDFTEAAQDAVGNVMSGAGNVTVIYDDVGDTITISGTTSSGGGTTDHGGLTGLGDDDHTIYSLADGSRAFTSTVNGVYPTLAGHLATKQYVDEFTVSGTVDRHGRQAVASGTSTVTVNFADLTHTNYTINATLENTIDSPPSIYASIISARTSSSFTMTFMGDMVSENYILNWSVVDDF